MLIIPVCPFCRKKRREESHYHSPKSSVGIAPPFLKAPTPSARIQRRKREKRHILNPGGMKRTASSTQIQM